jgi:hypothetical protein
MEIVSWSAVTCLPVISCYSPALKMEAIRSSETSVRTRVTWCHITEDDILQEKASWKAGLWALFKQRRLNQGELKGQDV